jgi:hypothetical protein
LNLQVVPPILSEPFTLVYKAGKVSVRYLGVLQCSRLLRFSGNRTLTFYCFSCSNKPRQRDFSC